MFKHKKILIVDDSMSMRMFEKKMLKNIGFSDIVEFDNITDAYNALNTDDKIEIVFSDINMPGGTGLDLLKKVRTAKTKFSQIPFFFITAEIEKQIQKEAEQNNVSGYFIKPIDEKLIEEKLNSFFSVG